jgi:hypothetical protein
LILNQSLCVGLWFSYSAECADKVRVAKNSRVYIVRINVFSESCSFSQLILLLPNWSFGFVLASKREWGVWELVILKIKIVKLPLARSISFKGSNHIDGAMKWYILFSKFVILSWLFQFSETSRFIEGIFVGEWVEYIDNDRLLVSCWLRGKDLRLFILWNLCRLGLGLGLFFL